MAQGSSTWNSQTNPVAALWVSPAQPSRGGSIPKSWGAPDPSQPLPAVEIKVGQQQWLSDRGDTDGGTNPSSAAPPTPPRVKQGLNPRTRFGDRSYSGICEELPEHLCGLGTPRKRDKQRDKHWDKHWDKHRDTPSPRAASWPFVLQQERAGSWVPATRACAVPASSLGTQRGRAPLANSGLRKQRQERR